MRRCPAPCGFRGYDHVAGLPEFREGLFYVQDLSSMRAVLWADPKEGDQVLDVCAAPGGKAIPCGGDAPGDRDGGGQRPDRL